MIILMINLLKAQVAAPQLRCLSVGASGDVTLTWIPPSDPGGQFFSYEICQSTVQNGVYTIVGTVSSIGTTTYNHAAASATGIASYYFVKTKFGPGGINTSQPSDTLKTIFLNLATTPGLPGLSYNQLHQPPLASTSVSFSVLREHPIGTWVNIGNTGNLNYVDTITICTPQQYNYQVIIGDGSGCISVSNIKGSVFKDEVAPPPIPLDSVSVLPNGQTVVGYGQSGAADCIGYTIYQQIPPLNGNTPISFVNGNSNTIFTFTSTAANAGPLTFNVAASDSCQKNSFFLQTNGHKTMFLTQTYSKCKYETQLSWTPYVGWSGIFEYRVYYSVNGGAFQLLASTSNNFYAHSNVTPDKNVTYYVRAFNSNKTASSSSNRVTFFSAQTVAPDFIYISSASVTDDKSIHVKFIVDAPKMGNGFDLYRSDDGVSYQKIAFIPFTGGPTYSYDDKDLYTREKSYYYKALAKDSCGNDRTQSSVVRSVWLQVSDVKQNMFQKKLTWNNYTAFAGGLGGYSVYRIVNDVVPGQPTGYTNGLVNEYVDNVEDAASEGSKIEYMVIAIESLNNPHNIAETANSNRATTYVEADVFIPTAFAPKGVNKEWLPVTHFVDKNDYNLKIFNRWGNLLFNTNDDTKGWNGEGAPNDTYVYLITYKNSRGEYIELKGTFTLL
jgi:gliding motility-associated-like protein